MSDNLQDLLNRFDDADDGANARLAWYGQQRAAGGDHEAAVASTAEHFDRWVAEHWPKRGLS